LLPGSADVSAWKAEIDELVYSLYRLMRLEICIDEETAADISGRHAQ
jgi:hypothetical protein